MIEESKHRWSYKTLNLQTYYRQYDQRIITGKKRGKKPTNEFKEGKLWMDSW
jgi:hypothetical protein